MIKKYLFIISSIILANSAIAQITDTACMPIRKFTAHELAFKERERLTIVANYKWGIINTDVGEATFTLSKERFRDTSYFYARAYAKTYKFYDRFFKVRDVYEARFLTADLRPIYFHRNINEGGYLMKNTYHFNNTKNTIYARIERKSDPPVDTVMQGKPCTFDFVSLFYNSRNLNFSTWKEGDVIPISFVVDESVFNLYYRYLGKEIIKVSGLGKFRCIKIAAKTVAGEVFDGKNEIHIWITDDENHIPIYIETPIIVGRISARLAKFDGLKHPLTSKVN